MPIQDRLREMMRMQNIFGASQPLYDMPQVPGSMPENISGAYEMGMSPEPPVPEQGSVSGVAPTAPPQSGFDPMAEFSRLYTPETQMSEAYKQHVLNMPQRQDPSILRRIAAGAVGMGAGPAEAERVLYGGYERNLRDWKAKGEALHGGASLERFANANERQAAQQALASKTAADRVDVARRVADARMFKDKNPNWKFIEVKGGNIMAFNPADPTKRIDTGIKSGQLSEFDKIDMQIEGRIEVAEETGSQARQTAATVHAGDMAEIERRGQIESGHIGERTEGQIRVKKTPSPGGANDVSQYPSQERVRILNNANRLKNSGSDYNKWITIDGNNVNIKPPSGGFLGLGAGPTQEQFNDMNKQIFGYEPETPAANIAPTASPTTPKKPGEPGYAGINEPVAQPTKNPEVGHIKTFPNGRKGRWNGQGYVMIK